MIKTTRILGKAFIVQINNRFFFIRVKWLSRVIPVTCIPRDRSQVSKAAYGGLLLLRSRLRRTKDSRYTSGVPREHLHRALRIKYELELMVRFTTCDYPLPRTRLSYKTRAETFSVRNSGQPTPTVENKVEASLRDSLLPLLCSASSHRRDDNDGGAAHRTVCGIRVRVGAVPSHHRRQRAKPATDHPRLQPTAHRDGGRRRHRLPHRPLRADPLSTAPPPPPSLAPMAPATAASSVHGGSVRPGVPSALRRRRVLRLILGLLPLTLRPRRRGH